MNAQCYGLDFYFQNSNTPSKLDVNLTLTGHNFNFLLI